MSHKAITSAAVTLSLIAGMMCQVAEAASSGVGGGSRASSPAPAPAPAPRVQAPAPAPVRAPSPPPTPVLAPKTQAQPPQAAAAKPAILSPAPAPARVEKSPADTGVAGGSRYGMGVAPQSQMAKQAERDRALAAGVAAGMIANDRNERLQQAIRDREAAATMAARDTSRHQQNTQIHMGQTPGITRQAPMPAEHAGLHPGQGSTYRPSQDYYPYQGGSYRSSPEVVYVDRSPTVVVHQPPVAYGGGVQPVPVSNSDWRPTPANNQEASGVLDAIVTTLFVLAVAGLIGWGVYAFYDKRQAAKNRQSNHSLS